MNATRSLHVSEFSATYRVTTVDSQQVLYPNIGNEKATGRHEGILSIHFLDTLLIRSLKAAWCLQGFATVFYCIFAIVM